MKTLKSRFVAVRQGSVAGVSGADLVERFHWLTDGQLVDCCAGRPDYTRSRCSQPRPLSV